MRAQMNLFLCIPRPPSQQSWWEPKENRMRSKKEFTVLGYTKYKWLAKEWKCWLSASLCLTSRSVIATAQCSSYGVVRFSACLLGNTFQLADSSESLLGQGWRWTLSPGCPICLTASPELPLRVGLSESVCQGCSWARWRALSAEKPRILLF